MELYALGTGSAFTMKNWQSNFLIRQNGKCLLLDAGGDCRFSLAELGITINDIDAVYVSHLHADHIGGLEWGGFITLFNPKLKKPTMFGEANLLRDLWNKSLVGGMEGLEGTKYIEEHGNGVLLSTYFEVSPIATNSSFVWESIKFDIIQSVHITCKYALSSSFGLMWTDPDTKERVYLTTDCQYSPEASMKAFYTEAGHIFHDCETSKFKSGVHANYEDLRTLPTDLKAKIWLYHYQDNVVDDYESWNNRAVEDGFRGFIKTGASFARTYTKQEGGTVGSLYTIAMKFWRDHGNGTR
jgi:ribonuclease BN (tRNA processing enzyme)